MLRILSRAGQIIMLAVSIPLLICEALRFFMPGSIFDKIAQDFGVLALVGFLSVALVEIGIKYKTLQAKDVK